MQRKSIKINAVLNMIKEIMSIIFPMITFPYATQILGAENYGKYIFSSSIVNYISYIAAAGILRYAIRECASARDEKKKCEVLVNEIYTINIITTLIAFIFLGVLVAFWSKLHSYAPIIFTLSLTVVFTTVGADWINSAYEDYAYITLRYIICQSFALIFVFTIVRSSDDVVPYAFVTAFGAIAPNIANRIHIKKKLGITPKFELSNRIMKHIKPLSYLFACTVATFIYINSDITVLGIFHTDEITGYYGVSSRFYSLVKQVMNAAFVVLIPRISNELAKETDKSFKQLHTVLHITIICSVPASVGLIMIRKNLILLFSGMGYIRAESSLLILGLAIIPAMLANFYINIVMIPMKLEKKVMQATIISAVVNLILNIILVPKYAENATAFTTLLAECIMFVFGWYGSRQFKFGGLGKPISACMVGSIGIFFICFLINKFEISLVLSVTFSILFSGAFYLGVLLLFYKQMLVSIIPRRRKKK